LMLEHRQLVLSVASGDSLDVRRFKVTEGISSLFKIILIVVCRNEAVDFDTILGQAARFTLRNGMHERTWTGLCAEVKLLKVEVSGLSTYELKLVPSLWRARKRRNYRIFQALSDPEIALKMLRDWGIEPVCRVGDVYKRRPSCVQYGESDYTF